MLDLVGCFMWGEDEEVALSRVPSAVGAYASWLAEHGETAPVPHTDATVVVERVTPSGAAGSERTAILGPDRRPGRGDALEPAMRRLDFARQDLLALIGRLDAWEAE